MKITFKELTLKNFKSHRDLTVNFGEVTKITGDNAKGKSSISEAITWLLYGTDMLGSKLDPTPITYNAEETLVTLLLDIDGKSIKLGRELKKANKYYINDVPSKAKDFNNLLDDLFDKDMFLSLFNPNYFFTLHWEKQREMVLTFVTPPSQKQVLEALPELQSKKLAEQLKKHRLDDLQKIHKENKSKKDKEHIAAQSRVRTLEEQTQESDSFDLDVLKQKEQELTEEIDKITKLTSGASENNARMNYLNDQILRIQSEIKRSADGWSELRDREINFNCPTCGQALDQQTADLAIERHEQEKATYKEQHKKLVVKRNELQKELAKMELFDISEQLDHSHRLSEMFLEVRQKIKEYEKQIKHKQEVEQAKLLEEEILESRNNSIFILDAIKSYEAKAAQLQGNKAKSLFNNLSINLFETLKNGDLKPTFEIEMDNKPYRKLSLSECIRAGLELRDVFSKEMDIIVPCFVDNAESITSFKKPNGQLITSKVVAGQELKIEGVDK